MKLFAKFRVASLCVFIAAITFTTILSHRMEPPIEDHRTFSFGWPMAWLYIHMIDSSSAQNGDWIQGTLHLEELAISWGPLLVSFSVAAAFSIAVTLIHFYWGRRADAAQRAAQVLQ